MPANFATEKVRSDLDNVTSEIIMAASHVIPSKPVESQ